VDSSRLGEKNRGEVCVLKSAGSWLSKPSEELAKRLANLFKEDEEKFIFLARDIPKVINDLKKKFPKQAPLFFRKALDKGGKE